jgi:hypothetical protein
VIYMGSIDKIHHMEKLNFNEAVERSLKIRERYHELELQHHGSEWTIEEDALAFFNRGDGLLVKILIKNWNINLVKAFGGWWCWQNEWILIYRMYSINF